MLKGGRSRSYDKNFKAKVDLEALREERTLLELGRKYNIHPSQLAQWKKQLHDGVADLFERPNKRSAKERESEEREEALLKKEGLMSLQVDFLKKSTVRYTEAMRHVR